MTPLKFIAHIETHWKQKKPFVLFSEPNEHKVTAYLQEDAVAYITKDFNEESFIFAPFDYKKEALCILKDTATILESEVVANSSAVAAMTLADSPKEEEAYKAFVQVVLAAIKRKEIVKAVTSRKRIMELPKLNFETLVSAILSTNISAFRYLWFHPITGLWCGATPEVLFSCDGTSFSTMALAGTQKVIENNAIVWGYKEQYEQQVVTDAIVSNLQKLTAVIKTSKPQTHIAGSLAHLKTDIKGVLKNGRTTIPNIASVLHPTPAVCGTPTKIAKKLLLENEHYSREFYTGFLGIVHGKRNTANLFVNLRCMKIVGVEAHVYAGGGITSDSEPNAEWEETQNKMTTMLRVLGTMI